MQSSTVSSDAPDASRAANTLSPSTPATPSNIAIISSAVNAANSANAANAANATSVHSSYQPSTSTAANPSSRSQLQIQSPSQNRAHSNSASGAVNGAPDEREREPVIGLPAHFEDVVLDDLVILISDLLERMIAHNDQIPLSPEGLTRFHSRSSPAISIVNYLRRITQYIRVERSVLLLMLHSIDQICARRPSFNISSLSVHRFLIASITILSKAFCDAFAPNPQFARVGGVSLIELNLLEREFLSHMEWRLACTREVLHAYYVKLVRTHSSGRYVVPDSSPRPTPIDTLPSDQIQWDVSNIPNVRNTKASSYFTESDNLGEMASNSMSMSEDDSDSSSDEDEMLSSPAVMATDARPIRRMPSRNPSSAANSPAFPAGANLSGAGAGSSVIGSVSAGGSRGGRRSGLRASSATLEQNIAFAEMKSGRRVTHSTSSISSASAASSTKMNSALNSARSPMFGTGPGLSMRSPVVGRRRRRSSANNDRVLDSGMSTGTGTGSGPSPRLGFGSGSGAGVGTDIDIEGILRGSRRRRIHTESTDTTPNDLEGDRRMEIGTNESSN